MPAQLMPIYPKAPGIAPVGRHFHRYHHGRAYIPYQLGITQVPDIVPPHPESAPPLVSPETFTLTLPTFTGTMIGMCTANGNPFRWAITEGNANEYWAINHYGVLTVGPNANGILAGVIHEVSVVATNNAGDSLPAEMFINVPAINEEA